MKKQIKGTLTFQNLTEQIKGTLKHLRFWPDLDLNGGVINSNTVVSNVKYSPYLAYISPMGSLRSEVELVRFRVNLMSWLREKS